MRLRARGNITMDYGIFEKFDKSKMQWSRWVERFEGTLSIVAPEDAKKLPLLLVYMGSETYDVLCDKLAPSKPTEKTYNDVKGILKQIYDPEPLEILENYRFHLRKQADDETVDEFSIALRKLAIHCNFGNYLTTALRNQFVFGLRSARIQNRLLETSNLTNDNALTTAKAMELSAKGGAEIQQQKESKVTVNYIHQRDRKAKEKASTSNWKSSSTAAQSAVSKKKEYCYRCGRADHRANRCTHQNSTCSFCNKKGHLKAVCFKAQFERKHTNYIDDHDDGDSGGSSDGGNGGDGGDGGDSESDSMEELFNIDQSSDDGGEESQSSKTPEEILNNLQDNSKLRSKFQICLKINDISLGFEIDSGSPVTIISDGDKQQHFRDTKLNSTNTKLVSYCGTQIQVLGFIVVRVNSGIQCRDLKLYVVQSNRKPLLGREWLRELKLNWNEIFSNSQSEKTVASIQQHQTLNNIEKLKAKYSNVFEKSMGKIQNVQAHIRLKSNVQPIFIKARKIPFALLESVENELDDLEKSGIIKKVESSRWATPIVPIRKAGNKVRICGDYKITVNPRMVVEEHPLPTIEELFASMAGGDKFTKIDLTKAYLQLEVHPDDQEILTLSTHRGLYQPTRLMYGIASGPAKWQREIEQILKDIDGVSVFLDDIKITAPNDNIHLQRLEMVLQRLSKYNMRVNFGKCEFMANDIEYCGYKINRLGIHKIQSKIDAIVRMPEPKNKEEVRAYIGLVNYYGRFFPNLSTILYPLNNLLKDKVDFIWNKDCIKSFRTIQKQIQSEVHLTHYDPKLPLVLAVDASPVGVGAVLSHIYPDGTERPIQFASQTLSPVQQRYSQIDREAYAIIFGIRKFYQYVYGRKFILITDNRPLSQIISPAKGLPTMSATRMQHYAIFLQSFDYEIRYRKSAAHCNADALSRLPLTDSYTKKEEINLIEINLIETLPISVEELRNATIKDESIHKLIQALQTGEIVHPEHRYNIDQTEFTLQNDCLLRGARVYVPLELRKRVLDELHTAHFGISRMKSLARSYCWWPGLDKNIENVSKNCLQCQQTRSNPKKVITHIWEAAKKPFERVHVDFAGPFLGSYFFLLIDAFTKWPEVFILQTIQTKTTIEKCREIFSRFGIPEVLVSDNGAQFTSNEFQHFMQMNGIIHKRSAPYHPATNGQVERNVQTFKNKLKTIKCERSELPKVLNNILLNYRRTPHATTGISPSSLMFNRQIRSRLDSMIPKASTETIQTQQKDVQVRKLNVNDRVSVRNYSIDEKYKFGIIVEVLGKLHYMVKLDDGRIWKRHIDQIHKMGSGIIPPKGDPIPYHYDISQNQVIIPNEHSHTVESNSLVKNDTRSINENQVPCVPIALPIVAETTSNSEQSSHVKRVRRQPNRLNYDSNFKQISK